MEADRDEFLLSDFEDELLNNSFRSDNKPEVTSSHTTVPQTVYNSRDPAAAQSSSTFSAAFSNLKKSAFYQNPEVKAANAGAGENSTGSNDKAKDNAAKSEKPNSYVSKPVEPGATRQLKTGPLLVSPRQRGNPLLKAICNVPWEYQEIIPDYQMGATTCALFLSLRYHNLNPDYIHERLKQLGKKFKLQVLVVQVDLVDPNHAIKHLNRLCLLADLTLMLAGSAEEAGRIIETYKMFENKPPELIMEKKEDGMQSKVLNALTAVRSVNKTDAYTLLKTFETLENILRASPEALELCPGFGPQKAQRLHAVLHQAFLRRP